jgi:hypothetical protein
MVTELSRVWFSPASLIAGVGSLCLVNCGTSPPPSEGDPPADTTTVMRYPGERREARVFERGDNRVSYEVVDGVAVIGGDMVMGPVDEFERDLLQSNGDLFGNWQGSSWGQGEIKYSFDDQTSGATKTAARAVMDELQGIINVLFKPCTGLCIGSHIKFVRNDAGACWSWVGKKALTKVNLGSFCDSSATSERYVMMHEIMHALGFLHEHQRCDRGSYVTQTGNCGVDASNLNPVCSGANPIGAYDYESIMHYGGGCFSAINATFQPLIGNRTHLSAGDRAQLQLMYGRSTSLPFSGDRRCNGDETHGSCPSDCPTTTPTGQCYVRSSNYPTGIPCTTASSCDNFCGGVGICDCR